MNTNDPLQIAVCLGLDAFRLALGKPTRNFTPMQVSGLLRQVAEERQPLVLSQAVLDCHAQFGGDLEDMQRKYDASWPA